MCQSNMRQDPTQYIRLPAVLVCCQLTTPALPHMLGILRGSSLRCQKTSPSKYKGGGMTAPQKARPPPMEQWSYAFTCTQVC
jgi:hypothetical protein